MRLLLRPIAHVSLIGIVGTAALFGRRLRPQTALPMPSGHSCNGCLPTGARAPSRPPDILFVGKKLERGYDGMLDGCRKQFSTREKIGTLQFSQLEVQPLGAKFSVVRNSR